MSFPTTLRGFRDYDEKDVINLYTVTGALVDTTYQVVATKGQFVSITGEGFRNDTLDTHELLGNFGAFNVNNFVAQRYGVSPKVAICPTGTAPLGMLLFDVRELDENLLPLKYNPRKAAEMEVVLSGQAVPIVTRGIFLYSGIQAGPPQAVVAGLPAYVGANGGISTTGSRQIGKFLGTTGIATPSGLNGSDMTSVALVWVNCT